MPTTPQRLVKHSYRVCGWATESKNRRSMFTTVGLRDRLAHRLSQLTGLAVVKDELSEFMCKRCVTALEKAEDALRLQKDVVTSLSATTLRHQTVLRYRMPAISQSAANVASRVPLLSTGVVADGDNESLLSHSQPSITNSTLHGKHPPPTTPGSIQKPAPKRIRQYVSPSSALSPHTPQRKAVRSLFRTDDADKVPMPVT